MRSRPALVLAVLALPLLAGCLGAADPAGSDDPADGGGRQGRVARGAVGETGTSERPETLYLSFDRLEAVPDSMDRDGWGFRYGGDVCVVDPASPPSLLPCWGRVFGGPALASHSAGAPARLSIWLQGTAAEPVVAEASLAADGAVVAEGRSQPVMPTPGTQAPGDEGCVLAEADLPLAADVPGGTGLALTVRVPGLFGGDCHGGGEGGNRLAIGMA